MEFNKALVERIAECSAIYENLFIEEMEFPIVLVGRNGLYLFSEEKYEEKDLEKLYSALKLNKNQVFLFVDTEEGSYFYDYTTGYEAIYDVYASFENCYNNHLIPEVDAIHLTFERPLSYCDLLDYQTAFELEEELENAYIPAVISNQKATWLAEYLVKIENAPVVDGNYRTFSDGRMEVKKIIAQKVGPMDTFIESGEAYFPCMEMDGDKFYLLTFLGGMFGIHKFKTGNYLKGIGYLLTLGCCGVFYVLDLIAILFGFYNYSFVSNLGTKGVKEYAKEKFFSRPVKNKKKALIMLAIAIVVAYLAVRFLYYPMITSISQAASDALAQTTYGQNLAENFIQELGNLQNSIPSVTP